MYAKVKQSSSSKLDNTDNYENIYHYTGWTTRYSSSNITIHHYSKESSPPEGFVQAEYGARSVPGFAVPFSGQSKGVKQILVCQKSENKPTKNRFGSGMVVSKRTVLSESCSKGYDEIDNFEVWRTQADAPTGAVNIFVTKKKSWPFDTMVTFTYLGKSDEFKPAFSFWAIPIEENIASDGFVSSSALVVSGIRSDRMTIEWRKDPFIKSYNVTVIPQPEKMAKFHVMKSNRLRLKGLKPDTEYTITVTPTTSSGIELEKLVTRQATAPAPESIKFPMVRSTVLNIEIPEIQGAEDYRIKIEPEVQALESRSSTLSVRTEPNTAYTVSLVVILSKAKDIQTTEISRSVKTAPSPNGVDVQMQIDNEGFGLDLTVKGLEKLATGYRFKVLLTCHNKY